jgi:non-specific serine/threonine protein kinase
LQTLSTLVAVQEKLDFENRKYQLDLFGNEIPVAKEYLKALIVPSSLVFNWYNEARKFTPHWRVQYVDKIELISKENTT